jgi:DNA helicase-2/ATP-dependent DNA helicase PcrA
MLVTVKDEADQAAYIVEQVLANREVGMTLKQQAVLFRTSSHSNALEIELTGTKHPVRQIRRPQIPRRRARQGHAGGMRFSQNPRDRVAGFRVLQLLPGIGPQIAGKILDTIAADPEPLQSLAEIPPPAKTGDDWPAFVTLVTALRKAEAGWPAEIGTVRMWYEPHLGRNHEDADTRKDDLLQLEQIASGYASRERFLTELTLDPPDATSDQAGVPLLDEDYLILSTIHSAKGQEWRAVYMLNVVDGCMPSDLGAGTTAELEEERRCFMSA